MERQRHRGGAGHQHQQCRSHASATGRGGVRGDAEAQIQPQLRPAADFRRSGGGETDHSGLLAGPGGVRPLEPASARRKSRRIEHRRQGQRQYDRTDSKKNALKPHRNRQWVIPPDANAGFVAAMEDVLETYQRPRDPDRPLVCLDETSKQLIAETRAPIPAKPGQPARHDYEYERNGVGQSLHDLRAAGGVAARRSDRPPRRSRLRESPQRLIRCAFPRRRENRAGSGQPEHPYAGLALCRLPRPRSPPPRPKVRMALHAQARKLARHGRIRTRRSDQAVPEPPHPRQADPRERSGRLGAPPKQAPRQSRLAIHNSRRPRQTQKAVPSVRMTRATSLTLPLAGLAATHGPFVGTVSLTISGDQSKAPSSFWPFATILSASCG